MSSDRHLSPIPCPASWRPVPLRKITKKIGSGATPIGGQATYTKARTTFALVRSQNVLDRAFSEAGLAFISDEQAKGLQNVRLEKGDLLLNITGDGITFARACMVPQSVLPACVNQHVSIIRADLELVDPHFLLGYLTHPTVKRYIEAFNAGGSRRAITKAHIESFVVPLPPLDLQRAIGATLSAIDDRIALLRETNATLEAVAQALFKSWFVDFDPVRARMEGRVPDGMDDATAALFPDGFEDSEMGVVPEGWRWGHLGQILTLRNERTKASNVPEHFPYVPIENISPKHPFLQEFQSGEAANTSLTIFRQDDILFGAMRPYFHKVCSAPFDGVTRTTVFTLTPIIPAANAFALFCAYQESTIDYATQHSEGSTIPYAKWQNSLERMSLVIPPEPVQMAFSSVASQFVQRANENVKAMHTLASIRDALLPRLISGQLRLDQEVEALEPA